MTLRSTLSVLALAVLAAAVRAEVASVLYFTNALAVAEGETTATSNFDVYGYTEGTGQFVLNRGGNYVSEIVDEETGLGWRWNDYLRHGFLTVYNHMNWNDRDRVGVRTVDPTYRVMNSNLGSATVGTIYTIFRPQTNLGWGSGHRNTLWGFGHTGYSTIVCWKDTNADDLLLDFTVKTGNPGNEHYVVKINPGTDGWKEDTWYLVAASFPGQSGAANNAQVRFWMRELSPRGPAFSPDPIVGVTCTDSGYVSYYPAASNKWPFEQGGGGALGIGGYFNNPGGGAGIVNGLGGDICYFRTENAYLAYDDFNERFESLGLMTEPQTVLLTK